MFSIEKKIVLINYIALVRVHVTFITHIWDLPADITAPSYLSHAY